MTIERNDTFGQSKESIWKKNTSYPSLQPLSSFQLMVRDTVSFLRWPRPTISKYKSCGKHGSSENISCIQSFLVEFNEKLKDAIRIPRFIIVREPSVYIYIYNYIYFTRSPNPMKVINNWFRNDTAVEM